MYINSNENWMRYSSTGDWKLSNIKDGGKWMHFYSDRQFAINIINKALDQGVVKYAKHTKGNQGVVCFYVSGTSIAEHRNIIKFMIDNNLIRLTTDFNYFNTAFKFNGQSWSKKYGPNFEGVIKLSDFINLNTGQPIAIEPQTLITIKTLTKSKLLANNIELKPLIDTLDKFILDFVNDKFNTNLDIDINDKIQALAPKGYNLRKLYTQKSTYMFLAVVANTIAYNLKTANPKQQAKIKKLHAKANNSLQHLITLLANAELKVDGEQNLVALDPKLVNRFVANYHHLDFDQENLNVFGYLLFLSIYNISQQNIDYIVNNL